MAQPRIWIDASDLIRFFDGQVTPTGIARVEMRIMAALAAGHGVRARFCRVTRAGLTPLTFEEVARQADGGAVLERHGDGAALQVARLARFATRRARAALEATGTAEPAKGDWLVSLGSSWERKTYAATVTNLKQRHGLRFALLVHDILPISHPQYVSPEGIAPFTRWLGGMADVWDRVLTPSRATADAVQAWLAAGGRLPAKLTVVPFGAGLTREADLPAHPGPAGNYALYVSTIEVRKNHDLLVTVWERLIANHGADRVPDLVFAGKFGWRVEPLKRRLSETSNLGGKVRTLANLSDGALARLYANARFTLFPSFCEGWGLPVGESLAFGRPCIASNATSIPEVGGDFCDYHDPHDVDEAYALIERAVTDGAFLEERSAHIARDYRPPRWQNSAEALVAALDAAD